MNCRLLFLRLYLPGPLLRRQLLELHRRAGVAFGCVSGSNCGVAEVARVAKTAKTAKAAQAAEVAKAASYRQLLETFATATRAQAQLAMASAASPEVIEALSECLRREAEEMGRNLRRRLRLRTEADFRAAVRIAYRALGIDARVSAPGELAIRRCFFSRFYSAPVCQLMSALDDGLVEGLSGGYRLRFIHRLTEGYPCCRATIERPTGAAWGSGLLERSAGAARRKECAESALESGCRERIVR